jgi:hypothetical protein
MKQLKLLVSLLALFLLITSCSKLKNLTQTGDRVYFCEKYTSAEVGEGTKFPTGNVTVMLKLSKPIGVSSVDVNVTDTKSNEVTETLPFTVQSSWDYIHFDDVPFKDPGKYKVSVLKKDGTVIASNEVEITK